MIRTVLAVALAAAIVGAATPALDAARTARTERLVAGELDRVEAAAEGLVREETPAESGEPGPKRTLDLSVPGDSPTTAPVAFLALGGRPERSVANQTGQKDVFAFRLAGGRTHVRQVGFDLRVAGRDGYAERTESGDSLADRPLVLSGGETHRLVLELRLIDGRPTVVASVRGFKPEDGTTQSHARPVGATPRP